MNTSEKAELKASVHYFERFSKSGINIFNYDTAGRKRATRATTRKTQAIAKFCGFHANTTSMISLKLV